MEPNSLDVCGFGTFYPSVSESSLMSFYIKGDGTKQKAYIHNYTNPSTPNDLIKTKIPFAEMLGTDMLGCI